MEEINDRVRKYITQRMEARHMSMADLAKKSGLARSTIDHFFDCTTVSPAFDRVCQMVTAVGGSVDEATGKKANGKDWGNPEKLRVKIDDSLSMVKRLLDSFYDRSPKEGPVSDWEYLCGFSFVQTVLFFLFDTLNETKRVLAG